MGILVVLKTFPSFATLLVADEEPTQAQRDIGVIRLQRIYNFSLLHAILYSVLDV